MSTLSITQTTVNDLKLTDNVITDISIDIPEISVDFGAALLNFLGTISFIKPDSSYDASMYMHLNIAIYDDMKCENLIGEREISTKNEKDKPYFSVFFTNNDVSKWIDATDENIINGFGQKFDKRPIVFNIGKWLKDFAKISTISSEKKYYILYTWSNSQNDSKSDTNSVIWPNFENY